MFKKKQETEKKPKNLLGLEVNSVHSDDMIEHIDNQVTHITLRNDLKTVTGTATATIVIDDTPDTKLYLGNEVTDDELYKTMGYGDFAETIGNHNSAMTWGQMLKEYIEF